MARKRTGVRSKPRKEVEVVSDDKEKLAMYCKPVTLYDILNARLRNNPYFIPKRLSYIIQAKKEKKTTSGEEVTFNYMDCNNKILKPEVLENFSCPFCSMKCGSPEGLKSHLTSSHDLFEYNFALSEKDHLEINVSVKPDAFRLEELSVGLENHHNFTFFRSKSRKRRQSNNVKRPKIRLLKMNTSDLPRDTENESSHVNDDNVSSHARAHSPEKISDILTITQPEIAQPSGPKVPRASSERNVSSHARAHSPEKISDMITITQPEIAQSSEPKVPRASRRKMVSAEPSEDTRVERLKKRQFYHSRTDQPMSFEQVMFGVDSETEDDDLAESEERMKLDRLVDVSEEDKRFMLLWNTFVRTQRVLADKHVPWACEEFVKLHVKELISPRAFGQWRAFMIKLWNHGLVWAKTVDKCNTFLHNSAEAAAAEAAAAEAAAAAAEAEAEEAAAEEAAAEEATAEEATKAAASASQATTANGNEQQAPMELDAE